MLLLAVTVATRAHAGQKRKDGTDYISHPVRVAVRCDTKLEKVVALLHDVVEDTPVGFKELRELGFSQEVLDALDSVTKRPGEKYADFVLRAKANEIGRLVKLADISDNLEDQSALDPDEAAFLTQRYTKAREVLDV
jgi:(p)ppGpp synthase/HD superfamily hydrolase